MSTLISALDKSADEREEEEQKRIMECVIKCCDGSGCDECTSSDEEEESEEEEEEEEEQKCRCEHYHHDDDECPMDDYEMLAHLVMEVGTALKVAEEGSVKDILKGALRRIADKRFDEEEAEIVFCCDWCRMPIIRNHEQHDNCLPYDDAGGERWFCRKKGCMEKYDALKAHKDCSPESDNDESKCEGDSNECAGCPGDKSGE